MPADQAEVMERAPDIEAIQSSFKQVFRDRASRVLARSSSLRDHTIEELSNGDDFVYGYWMALILVSGNGLRMLLKIHFDTVTGRKMLATKLKRKPEEIEASMAVDHLRESANLVAGALKTTFNQLNLNTGISIPLVTSGFDEAIFSDKVETRKIHDVWRLRWQEGQIVCSIVADVINWEDLAAIVGQLDEPEAESEDEFL